MAKLRNVSLFFEKMNLNDILNNLSSKEREIIKKELDRINSLEKNKIESNNIIQNLRTQLNTAENDNLALEGQYTIIDEAQQKLEKQKEELTALTKMVDQTTDSIIKTDNNFNIVYMNSSAEKLFGYDLEELIGKSPDIFNKEPLSEEIQKNIYELVASGKEYFCEDGILNKRKDGSTFFCQFKVIPLFNQEGEKEGYMSIQRDITKRKQAEELLKEKDYELTNRIKELTGLAKAREFLEFGEIPVDITLNAFLKNIIPKSMQYPDKVGCQIKLDDEIIKYNLLKDDLVVSIVSPIEINGKERGLLKVGYNKELDFLNPFEENLIDGYAKIIGQRIGKKELFDTLRKSK